MNIHDEAIQEVTGRVLSIFLLLHCDVEDVDWVVNLLDQVGWSQVNDKDKRRSCLDHCLINFVEHGIRFFINVV